MKKSYLKIMLESGRRFHIEYDKYKIIDNVLNIYLNNKLYYIIPMLHIEAIKIEEISEEKEKSIFIDDMIVSVREFNNQKEIKRCCVEGEKNAYNRN